MTQSEVQAEEITHQKPEGEKFGPGPGDKNSVVFVGCVRVMQKCSGSSKMEPSCGEVQTLHQIFRKCYILDI